MFSFKEKRELGRSEKGERSVKRVKGSSTAKILVAFQHQKMVLEISVLIPKLIQASNTNAPTTLSSVDHRFSHKHAPKVLRVYCNILSSLIIRT